MNGCIALPHQRNKHAARREKSNQKTEGKKWQIRGHAQCFIINSSNAPHRAGDRSVQPLQLKRQLGALRKHRIEALCANLEAVLGRRWTMLPVIGHRYRNDVALSACHNNEYFINVLTADTIVCNSLAIFKYIYMEDTIFVAKALYH